MANKGPQGTHLLITSTTSFQIHQTHYISLEMNSPSSLKGDKLKMCRPRARSRLAWVPPGVQVAFVVDERPPVALVGVCTRRALVAAVI